MDLQLLSAVASQPFEACEAEWKEVLRRLRLGLLYVPAIQRVLEEGRWKSAPNPIAYVRKSAVRAAVRLGLVDLRPNRRREVLACDLRYEDEGGNQLTHDDKLGTALHRHYEKYGRDYGERTRAESRLAGSMYTDEPEIDWERAGDLAGLDAGERLVIELQLAGLGRDTALGACLTERDRRYLQAAWRRYERNRQRLSQALQSGESTPAKHREAEWPELELILVETEEGELKISFRRSVPEEGF